MFKTAADIERFTELYENPNVTIDDICKLFGYAPGSIYRMGFELKLKRPKAVRGTQLDLFRIRKYIEHVSAELPAVIRTTAVPATYDPVPGELDFILMLSDEHAGRYTASTNAVVYGNRMLALAERVSQHVNAARKTQPIGQLHVFKLGDSATGERVGLNVTLEELEHTILDQCYKLAIPYTVRILQRLLHDFKTISVVGVPGNHGVVTRPQASKGANWDTVINLGVQAMMTNHPEVAFDIATHEWHNFATVRNTDWLLVHGDQFKGSCNYNSICGVVTQWHQSMSEHFDYVAMGHFHHLCKVREVFMNGTLLTDDDWSLEVVKRDGECVQTLIAVSDKGIEQVIPIRLDDITSDNNIGEHGLARAMEGK